VARPPPDIQAAPFAQAFQCRYPNLDRRHFDERISRQLGTCGRATIIWPTLPQRRHHTRCAAVAEQTAEKSRHHLNGHNQLPKIILGIKFTDGIEVVRSQTQIAAA
jgi:hypothetical protein